MSLAKLSKVSAKRVMGIDASTNSIAYCIFDGNNPVEYGEINFEGSDVYKRILDAKRKIKALKSRFSVEFVVIEAAVMVRSANTGLKMAYIFGAIMGELLENGAKVVEVHPLKWQGAINNPNLTKIEKDRIKKDHPGKSDNWYRNKAREIRKKKTIDFVYDKYRIIVESDNVADAIAIAHYGSIFLSIK